MEETPYLIGIDLGTTNISVAYINRTLKRSKYKIKTFEIQQVVSQNEIKSYSSLPSFHYEFSQHETKCIKMPWEDKNDYIIGEFAKKQKIPGNLVHSAKSWLCHSNVDRHSKILPWGSKSDIEKISPIEASSRYLSFLKECWNHYQAKNSDEFFEKQSIVLTVPAAFDQEARELTLEGAKKAGLKNITLLEEPMAAFYSWIYFYQLKWPKKINENMLALVCDVGGGTTDFSLIELHKNEENISFKRIAVGRHLLLGGDNMDLALAFQLEKKSNKKLSHNQFLELVAESRRAKEYLWTSGNENKNAEITIMGGGSSLVKGVQKFSLNGEYLKEHIIDSFFPIVSWDEEIPSTMSGLKEWGLPYEKNPCVTRHLCSFLQMHLSDGRKPDLILFNGGVLTPKTIRNRICDQLQKWFEKENSKWKSLVLTNNKLDLAVSLGATYFHLVQNGEGIHIGGGVPRSYYLHIKHENKERKGICILPFGSRQQQFFEIDQHSLEVIAKQPVTFSIYSSNIRKEDELGQIVSIDNKEMTLLPQLQTVIKIGKTAKKSHIPVYLQVQMNEIGLLDVRLVARGSDRIWRLQFEMAQKNKISGETNKKAKKNKNKVSFPEKEIDKILKNTFSGSILPRTLKSDLEKILNCKKNAWDLELNRKLWDQLILFASDKNKSEGHEERWFHLIGFCLRPGTGFPGDEWRINKLLPILQKKVSFSGNIQNWMEYWILLRRIASGLKAAEQLNILRQFGEHLLGPETKWKLKKQLRYRVKDSEYLEMWRTACSLENLPLQLRQQLGEVIYQKISMEKAKEYEYWVLGRIGARVLFYNQNPLPKEYVMPWIEMLLTINDDDFYRISTVAQLSRKTGDRSIDIDESLRYKVLQHLEPYCCTPKVSELYASIETISILDQKLQKHYLGDSLPIGLVLK